MLCSAMTSDNMGLKQCDFKRSKQEKLLFLPILSFTSHCLSKVCQSRCLERTQ
ncbi:hypothetical protein BAE44_0022489 [Dichanthelium oligosanthes]|uniref:Uncharacterized protein n=1 Tax=Dichanthelium oligosanthes TaxID=888268 RepID=A0A1E5UUE9_9POAL|nr:hypothetical protein BAE44_0022489 [Dichanthelium oligosanthes]